MSTLLVSAPLTKDALNFVAQWQEIDGLGEPGMLLTNAVRDRSYLSVRPELTGRTSRNKNAISSQCQNEISLSVNTKRRPRVDWCLTPPLTRIFRKWRWTSTARRQHPLCTRRARKVRRFFT